MLKIQFNADLVGGGAGLAWLTKYLEVRREKWCSQRLAGRPNGLRRFSPVTESQVFFPESQFSPETSSPAPVPRRPTPGASRPARLAAPGAELALFQ